MDTTNIVTILQASIAPFVLISGIGLLLLSMTNRISRPTEIIRRLLVELQSAQDKDRASLTHQIRHLRKRCALLRTAIFLSILAIVCVSGVTLLLFSSLVFKIRLDFVVEILFGASLINLMVSLLYLMQDIRITLHSLDLEIKRRTDN
ncbi:MAG: DUF2721 domain-containing protein [Pseudodesulfovibrio sp.]|nr:DUF2721 domain-containing protein [Pseudodesulfovibrio sp.]